MSPQTGRAAGTGAQSKLGKESNGSEQVVRAPGTDGRGENRSGGGEGGGAEPQKTLTDDGSILSFK